jgi:hypothetical protein
MNHQPKSLLLFLLLLLLPTALAVNLYQPFLSRSSNIICTTTSHSPLYYQSLAAADILPTAMSGAPCQQSSITQCTPLLAWGATEIAICGDVGYELGCEDVAEYVRGIAEECKERAGRRIVAEGAWAVSGRPWEAGFRGVVVYHS